MSTPARSSFFVEVRPMTLSPFKTVSVYSDHTEAYEKYKLERGEWYELYLRPEDQRFTFAGQKGTRRALTAAEAKRASKHFKRLGYAVRVTEKTVPLYPMLWGDLDANASVLQALHRVAMGINQRIYVASGLRSYNEQKILYNLYLAGKGNLAARPGTSNHETGLAVDAWINGTVALFSHKQAAALAAKHNLVRTVPSEAWHAELRK
jgi:hypothetical protein